MKIILIILHGINTGRIRFSVCLVIFIYETNKKKYLAITDMRESNYQQKKKHFKDNRKNACICIGVSLGLEGNGGKESRVSLQKLNQQGSENFWIQLPPFFPPLWMVPFHVGRQHRHARWGKTFFLMQNVSRFLNLHVQINIVGNHCNLVVSEMVKTFGGCGLGVGSGGRVE